MRGVRYVFVFIPGLRDLELGEMGVEEDGEELLLGQYTICDCEKPDVWILTR